jgi:two-component system, chemotaxis family, CheB/CheR fusion protein
VTGADRKRRSQRGSSAGATLPRRTKKNTTPAEPVEPRVDEAVTQGTSLSFSVVGVGASAGGLEAFTQLLRALPVDTGMAFVLVQHLAPTHESALAEILSRATSMPVTEVANEPKLEPNRVYVIPPGKEMIISRGHLQLLPRQASGKQHPIDHFFRSLAASQRQFAIGVVLSGTATDGTLGVEEIHAEGGITFAQDETAVQRGMPQSAIASGCVDFVLPPEAIAAEIARIGAHPLVTGSHRDPPPGRADRHTTQGQESLAPILHVLRNATGVDFTEYKTNTLLRRVRRRMVLQKRNKLSDYAELLRESSVEVRALYDDVLINVTRFFREPEVFVEVKKKVIPALLRDRSGRDPIRFWVVGCSTGEEAYSLAILLMEALESSNSRTVAQVFATDLNAAGIDQARAGVYSKERLENVSRERLRRFFVEVDGKYRVTKAIREMCVFSRHNLMADPPFSRMDLVSCRNLLIYLEPSLQQRILPVLHYALKPTGFLVLGASETVGKFSDLFESGQSKHRIYTKKPGTSRTFLSSVQGRRPEALDPGTKRPRSLLARAQEAGPLPALAGTDFHN